MALLIVAYIPTFKWMIERWNAFESPYSHGILIPLISIYLVWQRRDTLKTIPLKTYMPGLVIAAAGLMMHIICAALNVYFISGATFVFVLWGLILFFFGKEMMGKLIFPVFFLFAMVPMPLAAVSALNVKLKLFAAHASVAVLNRIGFPSMLDGSTIRMPYSFIEVAAPCSGLRSLISLLTLGLLFSYAIKVSYVKKAILFLSGIPIALASNIVRIMLISIVNDLYGEKAAMGKFHDFSGYMVFAVAFAGLYLVGSVLQGKKE